MIISFSLQKAVISALRRRGVHSSHTSACAVARSNALAGARERGLLGAHRLARAGDAGKHRRVRSPGRLHDQSRHRCGPRRDALSVVAQAMGIVVLVQASSPVWLILYVVIYGSAYGAFSPLRASVMTDHFGRRAYGAITAVQGIPVAGCAGLGPLAAGWLYDGLRHYEVAFWLCVAVFLLAAIGIALAPRPKE